MHTSMHDVRQGLLSIQVGQLQEKLSINLNGVVA